MTPQQWNVFFTAWCDVESEHKFYRKPSAAAKAAKIAFINNLVEKYNAKGLILDRRWFNNDKYLKEAKKQQKNLEKEERIRAEALKRAEEERRAREEEAAAKERIKNAELLRQRLEEERLARETEKERLEIERIQEEKRLEEEYLKAEAEEEAEKERAEAQPFEPKADTGMYYSLSNINSNVDDRGNTDIYCNIPNFINTQVGYVNEQNFIDESSFQFNISQVFNEDDNASNSESFNGNEFQKILNQTSALPWNSEKPEWDVTVSSFELSTAIRSDARISSAQSEFSFSFNNIYGNGPNIVDAEDGYINEQNIIDAEDSHINDPNMIDDQNDFQNYRNQEYVVFADNNNDGDNNDFNDDGFLINGENLNFDVINNNNENFTRGGILHENIANDINNTSSTVGISTTELAQIGKSVVATFNEKVISDMKLNIAEIEYQASVMKLKTAENEEKLKQIQQRQQLPTTQPNL